MLFNEIVSAHQNMVHQFEQKTQQVADNPDGKQVEFARTILGAGTDLLNLISDILDLSKIETATVTVDAKEFCFTSVRETLARPFRHRWPVPAREFVELRRIGGSSPCPGNIAFNFRRAAALNPARHWRFDMVRDIRSMPRGLLAPLTQAQLGSLRELAEGTLSALPDDHRARLLDLLLVEDNSGLLAVTQLGRERLVSDR